MDLSTRGDDLYDRAAWIVREHLAAGGNDPVTSLPQPPHDSEASLPPNGQSS